MHCGPQRVKIIGVKGNIVENAHELIRALFCVVASNTKKDQYCRKSCGTLFHDVGNNVEK
jgi:hypothetical protein